MSNMIYDPWGERGHSLVEVLVAVALMVAAVLPLSVLWLHGMPAQRGVSYAEALVQAQRAMEATLLDEAYASDQWWTADGRWRIERHISPQGRLVEVDIHVFHRHHPHPLVALGTLRIRP